MITPPHSKIRRERMLQMQPLPGERLYIAELRAQEKRTKKAEYECYALNKKDAIVKADRFFRRNHLMINTDRIYVYKKKIEKKQESYYPKPRFIHWEVLVPISIIIISYFIADYLIS